MPLPLPPAGVSPAAAFVAAGIPEYFVPAILADDIDPQTGELRSIVTGAHPVDAAVQEQLRLVRGSGMAVLEQGAEWRNIDMATEFAKRQLEDEAKRIMKPFVERGDVVVTDIEGASPVDGAVDAGLVTIDYVNRLSGEEETASR